MAVAEDSLARAEHFSRDIILDHLRRMRAQYQSGWHSELPLPKSEQIRARPELRLELPQLESIHPKEMACAVEISLGAANSREHLTADPSPVARAASPASSAKKLRVR